eukprot:990413-Amphidinium_carterae.1
MLELSSQELSSGEALPCTVDAPGTEVRVVQGLDPIAALNPGQHPPVKLWEDFIKTFENTYGLLPVNYDWRRWGDPVYSRECLA